MSNDLLVKAIPLLLNVTPEQDERVLKAIKLACAPLVVKTKELCSISPVKWELTDEFGRRWIYESEYGISIHCLDGDENTLSFFLPDEDEWMFDKVCEEHAILRFK